MVWDGVRRPCSSVQDGKGFGMELLSSRISRRAYLRRSVALASGLVAAGLLQACASPAPSASPTAAPPPTTSAPTHPRPRAPARPPASRPSATQRAPAAPPSTSTHPLPVRKGKPTKITKSAFMTQVATQPPVFALFVGHPDNITSAYLRFLENQLREEYGFEGTPIRMLVRKK